MRTIRKVLFINPPDPAMVKKGSAIGYSYFEPPLGLLYVYKFVKERGDIEARFLDLNIEMAFISKMPMDETLKICMDDFKPDMVAVAALYYSSVDIFHALAAGIKRADPDVVTAFGGQYPHHLTEKCLSDANVDYAVLSEGELGLSDLIDALNGKRDIGLVEGLAFKKDGALVRNPRKTFWQGYSDMTRIPWEDTRFEYYFKEGRNLLYRIRKKEDLRIAAMTATRGCPNQCTFCTSSRFWNQVWRKRKVAHVVDEINYLKKHYGTNTIVFNDENISVNKKWFIELLDALKTLDINWISSGGFSIRTINDEDVIRRMYESGIIFFNLAVESGSNETLKRIKKPLTIEESRNVIRLIRKYGKAFINAFIITGFHFDTLADVKSTLAFAESLDTDWKGFYCFRPLPGSQLFDDCRQDGLIDGFDPNYGEVYFASDFKHIDYTSQELDHLSYAANLKNNFVMNRNLLLGTEDSLAQAERDFLYVLDIAPDHVFACLALAEVMRLQNRNDARKGYILRVKDILEKGRGDWQKYLSEFNVNVTRLYQEVA